MKFVIWCTVVCISLCAACGSSGDAKGPNGAAGSGPTGTPEVAITPIGALSGDSAEALVTPKGGTLTSADGRLTIDVPAGALDAEETLTIQPIVNEAPGGTGVAYRLGPEGTTFSAPVTLTFGYDDTDLAGSEPEALEVAYQDANRSWDAIKALTLDTKARTVSVETTHFSDWSKLTGYQLVPPNPILKPGASVDLVVNICSRTVAGSDDLAELVTKCGPEPDFFSVDEWAVNGAPNGTTAFGIVAASGDGTATYTAPASAPSPNPVTVSARMRSHSSGRQTTLLSNVLIGEHPVLSGTVNSTRTSNNLTTVVTTAATLTLVYDEMNMWYEAKAGSTLTASLEVTSDGGCTTSAKFTADILKTDANIFTFGEQYSPAGATTGTYVGVSTCKNKTEAFSSTEQVTWWLTSTVVFPTKSDGSFKDSETFTIPDNGDSVETSWSLAPVMNK